MGANIKKYLVVVAGGKGLRMGGEIPKQFMLLSGKPVLMHAIEAFTGYDENIEVILVINSDFKEHWNSLVARYDFKVEHQLVEGGSERFHSVRNGLQPVKKGTLVAIHDAVRPLVSVSTIARCFEEAELSGCAVPVVAPSDSVRLITAAGAGMPVKRESVALVQTPQVFRSEIIRNAYDQPYSDRFTDDATVAEAAGSIISLVEGNRSNIKLTTPEDLVIAEALISNRGDGVK